MSINSILSGLNSSLRTYNTNSASSSQSIQRIATGSKYPSASYGPASYATLQRTYSNIGATEQAKANTQNANAMLNTAAGAAGNTVSMLTSLRDTLLNAANGTNGDTDLATLQKSVNQTIAGIDENAATATYNGKQLLNGTQSVAVQGVDGYTNVSLADLSSKGLGLTDEQGNSTLDFSSRDGILASLDKVDSALNTALDQTTTIGAAQQGLGYQESNLTTQSEMLYDTASTEGDTDIAKESVNLASSNTLQQAALFAIKAGLQNFHQSVMGPLGGINNHSRSAAVSMLM